MDELPRLIEPGVKSFLNSTLKTCREFKNKYNNTLLNIGLFIGLAFIISYLFNNSSYLFNNSSYLG